MVAAPDGRVRVVDRRAIRGSRPPAPATCCPASSARCSLPGSAPLDAAAAGAWIHGAAGASPAGGGLGRRRPARVDPGGARPARLAATTGERCRAGRWAWAEVDLDAVAHNVGVLRARSRPRGVWAVVKADGYGHGAVDVARAALLPAPTACAWRSTSEGVGAAPGRHRRPRSWCSASSRPTTPRRWSSTTSSPTVYDGAGIDALAARRRRTRRDPVGVHLKIDTGMHRVGALAARRRRPVPVDRGAPDAAPRPAVHPSRRWPTSCPTRRHHGQLARFDDGSLRPSRGPARPRRQLGRGARAPRGSLRRSCAPASRCTASRPGPASTTLAVASDPRCRSGLGSRYVKRLRAGDRLSYGLRHELRATPTSRRSRSGTPTASARNLSGLGGAGADRRHGDARSSAPSRWTS